MEREIIFEKQSISGFQFFEMYGMYAKSIIPATFALTVGESYIVAWDDDEYPVTAVDISALFPGGIAVGNGSGFGLPGNNEPFIVAVFETDITLFVLDPTDTRDTHSFGAYKEIEEETPVNIILRNPMGEEEEYPMRQMIELDTTDGDTVLYSKGEVLDSITIEPDFSEGDMTVNAPDGYLVKSAVIVKPENLKPENIAKDEVVAGVVGTHEGGGGDVQYVFTKTLYNLYMNNSTSSKNYYTTITFTLPAGSKVVSGECGWTSVTTTSSGYASAENKPAKYQCHYFPLTISETTGSVSAVFKHANSIPVSRYKAAAAVATLSFTLQGIYSKIDENGIFCLYADSTAVGLSESLISPPQKRGKIDLSASRITDIPKEAFLYWYASEIRFPATIQTIGVDAFDYIYDPGYAENRACDFYFTNHTFVPTLASANAFYNYPGRTNIYIPAELYDQWIAATNWSSLSRCIIAK